MRHYCGPIFLPHVANAIGGDDPRAGVQMGQAPRLSSAVGCRLTAAMVGTEPQPAKHSLPLALLHLSERCPAATSNSSCFKVSAPGLAR